MKQVPPGNGPAMQEGGHKGPYNSAYIPHIKGVRRSVFRDRSSSFTPSVF